MMLKRITYHIENHVTVYLISRFELEKSSKGKKSWAQIEISQAGMYSVYV